MTDLFRSILFATAHWCGGSLGGAIFIVSFVLRLLMLPFALRMARRAREQAAILGTIKDELAALQKRHAADPVAAWQATRALHRQAGYQPFSFAGFLGAIIQWPLMAALFSAVRSGLGSRIGFLWVDDLARPDRWLVAIVTMLVAGGSAMMVPSGSSRGVAQAIVIIPTALTFAFLWFASSAIAVSYGAGSLVSLLQGWLVRREQTAVRGLA